MDPLDRTFAVATAPARNSKHWQQETVTWPEVVAWAETPGTIKECGNYLMGRLRGGVRNKSTIASRSMVSLDADHANRGLPDQLELLLPYASLIHTTWRSSPDELRYRILFPADRDMTPAEYFLVATLLMRRLGVDQFDPGSSQPERYMFKPSAQEPSWYTWRETDGDLLPVDELLAEAAAEPEPIDEPPTPGTVRKRDPFELGGVVGAFNRCYEDLADLVQAFDLPYEQEEAERWRLVGADAAAGMGPVRPGIYFSHHAGDPAGGVACSAFDLVRLHRFGDLDAGVPGTTPVNRRPSQIAMMDLAAADRRVVQELVGADFSGPPPPPDTGPASRPDPDPDWRLGLRLSPRSGAPTDTIGNWDLICDNDPAMRSLYYNELSMAVEARDDLPWRPLSQGGEVFGSTDRAALCHYIEREYRIRPERTLMGELVATTAAKSYVNPVKDYLASLTWDGTPRVETCLPGVQATTHTRLVARKALTAAVARMFEPGIKWDHTLVLFGPEGIGKSFWVNRMSRGYTATLGRINDKDTLITMQRTWIMLSDEGHSLRKADADMQKEFLTRTDDVFRMPYERESTVHPRRCVIWGTTNDEVFLRNQEGNRRFLIVRCEEKVDFEALTDQYVDQVWAEAVHLYRAGEALYLGDVESTIAAQEREQFTEEDGMAGILQNYLDTLVPEEWDTMSPEARRSWLDGRAEGMVPAGTEPITQVCSAQLWVEALGRRIGDHKRPDLLEINTAMKRLTEWKTKPGRVRLPFYGPQLVFERQLEQ